MTYARLFELADLDEALKIEELQELGWVVAAAFHDPELLGKIGQENKRIDMDKLPAMLRIPKKKESDGPE